MSGLIVDREPRDTRVVVAMSGGVDSSTAAAMLVEQGYDVVGITLRLSDAGGAGKRPGTCCAGEDIRDARRVADHLAIPHYVLDLRDRFRTQVIAPFADSYANGETPIPCVLCNQTVKFTDLLGFARGLAADALVTGHYVRWRRGAHGPELHRAADATRDQSYFLFATTRDQLAMLRFPLGELRKDETRRLAQQRYRLPVANKPDSQDICFVASGRYSAVVETMRPEAVAPGEIVDEQGRVVGQHRGIAGFTVGQRRGLGIAGPEPHYVVRIDAASRRVVIGPYSALGSDRLGVRDVNWLDGAPLSASGIRVEVRLRSTRPPVPATAFADGSDGARVVLDTPQAAIAPGQACVFYRGDRVLGGGWIRADGNGR
jgi:tRNA-specific 2-thiouridylase